MKNTIALLTLFVSGGFMAQAQCVPESGFTGTGLTFAPSMLETVYACTDCGDHVRVISIQTFADTTLSVELAPGNPPLDVTVLADFFRLDSIGGLPSGLTYTTDAAFDTTYDEVSNPFGYWVNPGDTTNGFENTVGCISIEGDAAAWTAAAGGGPNSDGIYPLTLFIDARAANFDPAAIGGVVGFNTWLSDMGVLLDAFGDPNFTVNGIRLEGAVLEVVASGVGIEESDNSASTFTVYPNPADEVVAIGFQSTAATSGLLSVFNALGELVNQVQVRTTAGNNLIDLNCDGLEAGIYSLKLDLDSQVLTSKVVVR
jgi:hypothetical protein